MRLKLTGAVSAALVSLASVSVAATDCPYGTCAHITRDEFADHERTMDMLVAAGIRCLRVDLDWIDVEPERGLWRFEKHDRILNAADKRGMSLLPLLGFNHHRFANPAHAHLVEWTNYVQTVVRRYRGRFQAVEVWNEPNLGGFWPNPNAEDYAKLLKATYVAVKAADPDVKVAISGFSQVPIPFIENIYKAGAGKSFDIMNVHPYSWPMPPEGSLDVNLCKLRECMTRYGDREKPIWITEIGWPNAFGKVSVPGLLRAGLEVACGRRRGVRALYADAVPVGFAPRKNIVALLKSELPEGSTLEYCSAAELSGILGRGKYDVVINAVTLECVLTDGLDAMADFVRRGGILALLGGSVFYYAFKLDAEGVLRTDSSGTPDSRRERLRVLMTSAAKDRNIPALVRAYASPETMDGVECWNRAYVGERFFSPGRMEPGDRFVPLLSGPSNDGNPTGAVVSAVYKFNGSWKGAVIASGFFERGIPVDDEDSQASRLVRSLAIAFDCGVERFYNYEFRAPETDPKDPESYFGMVHPDFTPKAAFLAYTTFVKARPLGSVGLPGASLPQGDGLWMSQWRRPDGKSAGMVWLPGSAGVARILRPQNGGKLKFATLYGKAIPVQSEKDGSYVVSVSENPVYFLGDEIKSIGRRNEK